MEDQNNFLNSPIKRTYPLITKPILTLSVIFWCFLNSAFAQYHNQLDSLLRLLKQAATDAEKISLLGKLADCYYIVNLNQKGDSVLHEQLQIAELSNDNQLIKTVLFGNAILNASNTLESFSKTEEFIENSITFARGQNDFDYIALGYSRLANILRKKGDYDKALYNANLATQSLLNVESDSIKAVIYIELGNSYLMKGETVAACTNYNTAFDIAFKSESVPLQSQIYHCFAEMYSGLGIDDAAKTELTKSLQLNKENAYHEGMVRDYYDLARLTDEKIYIVKMRELADSFRLFRYSMKAKNLMLVYIEVKEKNSDKALQYLEEEPDLKQAYINTGIASYYNTVAEIYLYSGKSDSALHYFKLAENDFIKYYDKSQVQAIFWEMAQTYELLKDLPHAIAYYEKVLKLGMDMNAVTTIASVASSLSSLYSQQNNYKKAYSFSNMAIRYDDSLRNLSKEQDITLLTIERENRKHSEELRRQDIVEKRNRDAQYMAISIAICIVFMGMLVAGMFPMSILTLRLIGYFFFISLFEFIVLVIDKTLLEHATHGQPWKLWIIKILLIASLVPLQHFLEHNLIRFIASKKLLEARARFSIKSWFKKQQKPVGGNAAEMDDDTAVL